MSHTFAMDRAFAAIALRRKLAYKLHWVFGIVLGGAGLLVGLAMWSNLLGSGEIAGYDWDAMRAYLIIGFFTATIAFGGEDWLMADRILDGLIAVDLTKPVDFQRARAAEFMGALVSTVPTAVFGTVGAWLLFRPPGPVTPLAGALTAVSILLILPLSFGITYLSILVCFWTKRYLGIMWLREALLSFFSGMMIPLALMPNWMQVVAWSMPFAHFTTTPANIYLGRVDTFGALGLIAAEIAWVVGLWFAGRLIFKRAIKKVTVHGG
ncbi:ABC transporter permease [Glycomyces buryatensis]|uniref:Antibiotic ABC transporter permease n=1 Tax=Glycomyces buryatensis TaxID=2570927 RepID=A0A4S8Q786_9ACTN|nr:ABC-2 family transporter protein [Glycomyces buryatensis]THV38535.1 antibiotic ABC transporter permease [Glycomyces buryatensis]